jgi:hypothetical protein
MERLERRLPPWLGVAWGHMNSGCWSVSLGATSDAVRLRTALAERSGPIRRHWVEEAGGRLRALHDHPARFSVFRYSLNLFSKLGPLALFAAIAKALAAAEAEWVFLPAGVIVALIIAASEGASRALLGSDPEDALRRLTGVYRLLLLLLWPLIVVAAPLARRRPEPEEEAPPDAEASDYLRAAALKAERKSTSARPAPRRRATRKPTAAKAAFAKRPKARKRR